MALTKEQKAQRREGIGASEVAVIAGLSKWSTPIEIWRRKMGVGTDEEGTYSRALGVEIEEPIARVWAKQQKKAIARVATLAHPEHPLALATPDRAVFPEGWKGAGRKPITDLFGAESLLEVKSANWRMLDQWGPEGTDEVPPEYFCQAQWQAWVAGLDVVDFAVDVDKRRLRRYRVRLDVEFVGNLYTIAEKFWTDHVLARVPPPPDGTAAYLDTLKRWRPRETTADLLDVEGPEHDETRAAVFRLARLKALGDRVESGINLDRARVLLAIGERGGLTWQDADGPVVVTYRANQPSVVVDWEAAATEALALAGLAIQSLPMGDARAVLEARLGEVVASKKRTVAGARVLRYAKSPTWRFHEDDLQVLGLPPEKEKKAKKGSK